MILRCTYSFFFVLANELNKKHPDLGRRDQHVVEIMSETIWIITVSRRGGSMSVELHDCLKCFYICWTPFWHHSSPGTGHPVPELEHTHAQIGTLPIWGAQFRNWMPSAGTGLDKICHLLNPGFILELGTQC